jgi:hypothetical protein
VTKVDIRLVHFFGPVTAVVGNTITIAGRHGTSLNVVVSTTTTYTSADAASTFAAVVVGAWIDAVGLPDATAGTLDANSVNIFASSGHHDGSGDGKGGSSTSQNQGRDEGSGRGHGRH